MCRHNIARHSEEQSLELQYRNKKVYGTGLGTSVNWEIDENGRGIIFNDFFPEVEVPSMDFGIPKDSEIDISALSMYFLSDLDKTEKKTKIDSLSTVIRAYGNWIESLKTRMNLLETRYHAPAEMNINGCLSAKARMEEGLRILKENSVAWDAFRYPSGTILAKRNLG